MRKKQLLFFLLITAFLVGCEKSETVVPIQQVEETEQAQPVVTPVEGGTLRLSMRTTQTLNPLLNEDETVDKILKLLFEPFVEIDSTNKPVPSIAESWNFSENGSILTVKLKSGLNWQDGTSITSDDVIFSLQTIQQSGENTVYKKCVENIVSYTKVDRYTVRIAFRQPFSGNLYSLSFPLISADYFRGENIASSEKNMMPMGNGAFMFESFTPAKELTLIRTNNSFSKLPYIERIRVIITPDKDTDLYSFDQGIIDTISAVETDIGKYDSSKNTKRYEFTTNYYDFIGINFNRSILQDKNIRKAIAYAVPKKNILDGVYLNHALDAQTPVNPSSWLYEPDTQSYEYNLSLAKTYLEQSNWIDSDGDKVRDRVTNEYSETLKLSILVNTENEERKQIASRLADELRAIGFDMTIVEVPYEQYMQMLADKDFDLFLGGWRLSVVPDMTFMFHSSQVNDTNYISYQDETMDQLLTSAYSSIGETSILSAYSALQKQIAEELPYISLVFRNSAVFTSQRVYGTINPLEYNVYQNIEDWFIIENNTSGKNS